jgi:hypothetical protein
MLRALGLPLLALLLGFGLIAGQPTAMPSATLPIMAAVDLDDRDPLKTASAIAALPAGDHSRGPAAFCLQTISGADAGPPRSPPLSTPLRC